MVTNGPTRADLENIEPSSPSPRTGAIGAGYARCFSTYFSGFRSNTVLQAGLQK